ncbi:MAG: transposase [Acidobacteriota bacterium]|nr:transposase [Acidobacteriota bacterium]
MPRRNRIVVPGLPHHITQRGNGRHSIFDSDGDRRVFLALLGRYAAAYGMSIWGYCLMSNHFHLIVVPERAESAAKALGSLLASYARYLNVQRESCGHLWQARYYSVPMEPVYCWTALAYVEHNPVRAGMSETAERYRWSSAAARLGMCAAPAWLDLEAWREEWTAAEWRRLLEDRRAESVIGKELHEVTLSGYPLGRALVERLERELGKRLRRGKAGRPRKERTASATLQ